MAAKHKWLPVVSFLCFLFLLFSGGTLFGIGVGTDLVGIVVIVGTLIAVFFPDRGRELGDMWSDKFIGETHYAIVLLSLVAGGILLLVIGPQYRIVKVDDLDG
ncbi:MAG: hypothetical protein Q8P55_02225 [bacterium]|nr:hypothetical protein [bacterium]